MLLEKCYFTQSCLLSCLLSPPEVVQSYKLGLTTLETRRLRGDLLEVFKILNGFYKVSASDFFTYSSSELRGHSFKLYKPRVFTNHGKSSFSFRVINEWNLLTQDIVSCSTVTLFKSKLDHHLRYCRGFL